MAEQDFDRLLAAIKQINKEMESLIAKAAQARAELAKIDDPAARVAAGGRIGGYQTAAARKSQQSAQLKGALESSLSGLEGILAETENKIKQLSATEIAAGNNIARQLESELAKRKQITAEVQKLRNIVTELNQPAAVTHVATPLGVPDPNAAFRDPRINPQQVAQQTTVTQGALGGFGVSPIRTSTIPTSQNPWKGFDALIAEKRLTDQSLNILSEKEKTDARRLQLAKEMLQSETRYRAVLALAEKQGFGLTDLKGVRTRGTGGIQQVQFEKYNELGVRQNLDIFSSPSGRATAGLSNQFRTFGQGVVRDIGELTKWSLALAAVYGPLRKLGELTQEMIENQTKLADATISVNSSFLDQGRIFDIAAESAARAGEDVSGVIDAFTLAYRAAGGGVGQVERLDRAQRLLSDSLVLSKLSTLDQAGAIDTLAAAVRQTGGDFDSTTKLLDSWVRVTKVANVDLTTLATGFAVLGDAADAAGISADELNGIIAAIAETGISSGKETANIARALVSGFQSDQARRELEALGIAVEDASGNLRPFLDIMKEIHTLRNQELISDTQFSRLTLALGGGTRRQAAYSSFIENFDRVFDVAQESERASGDAEAALAKQLETVQTSLTRLGNSFSELAQTMGTEGGFLGVIQSSVNGLTSMVEVFDELIGLLGKATPAMVAFIAATVALKYKGAGSPQQALGGLIQQVAPPNNVGGQMYLPGIGPQLSLADRQRNFIGQNALGTNQLSGFIQGLALAAIPAIMNATNKQDEYGQTKAVANIIGGVGGGIIGSLVAGSPLIGAAVGTSIAEAFVNKTVAYGVDVFKFGQAPSLGAPTTDLSTKEGRDAALNEAVTEIYKSIGFGNANIGKFLASPGGEVEGAVEELNEIIKKQDERALNRFLNPITNQQLINKNFLESAGVDEATIRKAFAGGQQVSVSPERYAYNRASDEARRQYDVALAAVNAAGGGGPQVGSEFTRLVEQNRQAFSEVVNSIRDISKENIARQRLQGDLRGSEFARQSASLAGFDTKALQYYTAFGDEFVTMNKDIDSAREAFEAFNTVIVSGADDSIPELTSITAEIRELTDLLADPDTNAQRLLDFGGADEATAKLRELRETAASVLSDIYSQVALDQLNIPDVQGNINKPLQRDEYSLVTQTAQALQDQFYQGFLDIPDQMYEGLKDSFESWAQIIEDSGTIFYETVTGIDPQFFQQAFNKLLEDGKLKSQQASPFGIQQVDITSAQGAGLQGQIDYFSAYLAQNFPQYEQNPEDVGVIFSDYVTDVLHGDNLAIKLALEKILDVNQKQLDGMYNIPEGATFWVPLTAAYYRPQAQGGTGMPAVDAAAIDGNTGATEENTGALINLGLSIEGLKQYQESERNRTGFTSAREAFQERQVQRFRGNDVGRGNAPDGYFAGGGLSNIDRLRREYEQVVQQQSILPRNGNEFPFRQGPRPPESGGFGQTSSPEVGNFIETLKRALLSTLMTTASIATGRQEVPTAQTGSIGSRDMATVVPTVNARLDFRVENSTQLIVDGRVLASVVSPYLASDLLKLEASQGTITKRYII